MVGILRADELTFLYVVLVLLWFRDWVSHSLLGLPPELWDYCQAQLEWCWGSNLGCVHVSQYSAE